MTYFNDCKAYDAAGNLLTFTGIGPPPPGGEPLKECSTGASNWRIDVDAQYSGRPSLFIETSPVRHTNFQGIQTDNGLAVESRQVTRLRDTYFLDYHVFMFDFRVRTIADVKPVACSEVLFIQNCVYDTETAYKPGSSGECTQASGCGKGGIPFDGSSLIAFFINPWQGARVPDENTVRFGQWTGIMQAIIFEAEAGFDTKVPQDAPGFATAVLARNAAANMFAVTGEPQPNFQFGTATLDDDIPQLVLVELPYKLQAGADIETQFGGGLKTVVASNVNVHYIVRMDVLLVTGWQPQLDYIDDNKNGVRDSGEFTFIDRNNDNLWTPSIDEAVEGIPPPPPPTGPEPCAEGFTRAADGNCYQVSKEDLTTVQPEDPPQTGSELRELGPIPDVTVPAPCEFWNISCWFTTAFNFPTVSNIIGLIVAMILLVAIAFGASLLIGARRRGR